MGVEWGRRQRNKSGQPALQQGQFVAELLTLSGPWGWGRAEPRRGSRDTPLPTCLVQVSLPRPECEEEKKEGIRGFRRWGQHWGTEATGQAGLAVLKIAG